MIVGLCAWSTIAGAVGAAEPDVVVNSLGMRFVRLAAGEYLRGSAGDDSTADPDERPRRRVRITRGFALGQFEVTQAQYEAGMGENPSWFSRGGGGRKVVEGIKTANMPVEMVSWDDAVAFCRRLSELPAERAAGRMYRLPTESEWEYAARCGGSERFGRTAELDLNAGNFAHGERPRVTFNVGSLRPNAWGLYDMHGNVWEWCGDWYDADYYAAAPTDDPPGPQAGTGRVVRGGDYSAPAQAARCANRDFTRPSRRDWGNGLRVVLELPTP